MQSYRNIIILKQNVALRNCKQIVLNQIQGSNLKSKFLDFFEFSKSGNL